MANLVFGTSFKNGNQIVESVTSKGQPWFTVCITQESKGNQKIDRKTGLSSGFDEKLTFTFGSTDKANLLATQQEWLAECNEGKAFIYQERSVTPFDKKSTLATNPETGESMDYYQRTVLSDGETWEEVQKLHKQYVVLQPQSMVVAEAKSENVLA
jgi:hypothetical protein